MLRSYERLLARAPIPVKTASGALLGFAGDGTAQTRDGGAYDTRRGFAFTSLAAVWNGPCMHTVFEQLERRFPQSLGWRSLVPKMMFTQLVMNPFIYLPLFYTWMGLALGRTAAQTVEKAQREYWTTLQVTWSIFAPFNVVNFMLIPVRHQAFALASVSFSYQCILSMISNADRRAGSSSAWTNPQQLVRTLSGTAASSGGGPVR